MFGPDLRERLQTKKHAPGVVFEADGTGGKVGAKKGKKSSSGAPLCLWLDDVLPAVALIFVCVALAFGWRWLALLIAIVALWLLWRVLPPSRPLRKVRVVCISDTHGRHRDLHLPEGDILIHAGDFTHFGKDKDVIDFNDWLGTLPFQHKIVVNGNHENNAPWQGKVVELLTNACFLKHTSVMLSGLHIYGTDFCWPMRSESPLYALIPKGVDIVIAHGPVKGLADGGMGCQALQWAVGRMRPRLVVSGHIHEAHGRCEGRGALRGTTFVNAANCRDGYSIGWGPIVVDL